MTIDRAARPTSRWSLGRTRENRPGGRRRLVAVLLGLTPAAVGLVVGAPTAVQAAGPAVAPPSTGPVVSTAAGPPAGSGGPGSAGWQPVRAAGWCPARVASPRVRRSGPQRSQLRLRRARPRTTVDVRSARWVGRRNYPVSVSGGPFACVTGGVYRGTWPATTSWAAMHRVTAVRTTSFGSVVEGVRLHNYGDGVKFSAGAQHWRLRRAHLSYLRDDCVENDWAYSGVVEDSLLDGCYTAFSARGYPGQARSRNGSADLVTVRNSLVRTQPMRSVYKNRGPVPGHGGFFKWDPAGPRLSLRNNVFRVDQRSSTGNLGIPAGKLAGCSGNVVVWLGAGPYPARLPGCFRVTRDRRVWDRAVAAWKRAHAGQ